MTRLLVASGGSGDLIAALALQSARTLTEPVVLLSPMWERPIIDPHPGPRGPRAIQGLRSSAWGPRVTAETRTPGGWCPMAELARGTDAPLVLLDLHGGTRGVLRHLQGLVDRCNVSVVELVDVGGDILTVGPERSVVSVTQDAVLLSAVASLTGVDTQVTVLGWGLDGELPAPLSLARRAALPTRETGRIAVDVAKAVYADYAWYPSEACLMTLLAALGCEARVAIGSGVEVQLDERCPEFATFPANAVAALNPLTQALRQAASLRDVDWLVRDHGFPSELSRGAPSSGRQRKIPGSRDMAEVLIDLRCRHPESAGVTLRYLAKRLGLYRYTDMHILNRTLEESGGHDYLKPVYMFNRANAKVPTIEACTRPPQHGATGRPG